MAVLPFRSPAGRRPRENRFLVDREMITWSTRRPGTSPRTSRPGTRTTGPPNRPHRPLHEVNDRAAVSYTHPERFRAGFSVRSASMRVIQGIGLAAIVLSLSAARGEDLK